MPDVKTLAKQLGLPDSIGETVEFSPLQRVGVAILREAHPDVPIHEKIPLRFEKGERDAFVVVRRINALGMWEGRGGLLDSGALAIHVFSRDPDGETKGAILSEAMRASLFKAARNNWYDPEIGALSRIRVDEETNRKTDYATSAGPVQYADLPHGWWRHETRLMLWVRPASVWQP